MIKKGRSNGQKNTNQLQYQRAAVIILEMIGNMKN